MQQGIFSVLLTKCGPYKIYAAGLKTPKCGPYKRLAYLLYGSVASLPSPSSKI